MAAIFLGTLFAQLRGGVVAENGPTPAELADVLLNGVLKQPRGRREPSGTDGPRSDAA